MAGFNDGVQDVCGAHPADRIVSEIFDAGTTEQALTKTTDWLTAHPAGGFVSAPRSMMRAPPASPRRSPRAAATASRSGSAATTSASPRPRKAPADENQFLGCVAYYPEKYPDYVISIGLDVLEGKPVPQEVHIAHDFLDKDTIGAVYP